MNKTRLWIVLAALAAASLACNAISGGTKAPQPAGGNTGGGTPAPQPTSGDSGGATVAPSQPTADDNSGKTNSYNTEFPLPSDVSNFMELGEDSINFQTKMSLKDVMAFYQDAFSKENYKERKLLTVTSDTTFNLVFDGHKSGKAIVIQGVDLGGSTNVNIRLEAVN
jgi:hypothetical protein